MTERMTTFEQAEAARSALVALHPDVYVVRFTRLFNMQRDGDREELAALRGQP